MTDRATAPESAKALRVALKRHFPRTRFSVRLSRGTGYGWAHVSWTDGPTERAVGEVCGPFEGTTFDGRDDSTHYTGNRLPDGRKTGLRGINTSRSYSPDALAYLVAKVGTRFGIPAERWPAIEANKPGWSPHVAADSRPVLEGGREDWQTLVWREGVGEDLP